MEFLQRQLRNHKILFGTILVGIVVFVVVSFFRFGSVANAIAYAQGYSIIPQTRVVALGDVPGGKKVTVNLQLQNLAGEAVRIVGAESNCGCVAWQDLPIEVAPFAPAQVSVHFTPPKLSSDKVSESPDAHQIRHPIRLFLDVNSPPLVVIITGRLVPEPKAGLEPEPDLAITN